MMSRNVRRLVLDPFPLWQTCLGLLLWLIAGFVTALWASDVKVVGLMTLLSTAAMTMVFLPKVRTWQTLPVSRTDLGQAQWWYIWGRPFVFALVVTAAAVAIDRVFGRLAASWADIAAYFGAELTLLFLIGLTVPLTGLMRPSAGAAGLGTMIPILAALALGLHWSFGGPIAAFRSQMVWGGVISAGLVLAAFPLSRWIPLAQTRIVSSGKTTKADAAPLNPMRAGAVRATAGGGRLTVFLLRRLARILPFLAVVVAILTLVSNQGILKGILPFDMWLQFVPFFGGVGAMTLTATMSQRTLAGLPLSALQRTVALQAVAPLIQVPLVGLTIAGGAIMRPGGLSTDWLASTALVALGAIFMGAIALPMFLRFGAKAPVLFAGVGAAPVGGLTGVVIGMNLHPGRMSGAHMEQGLLIGGGLVVLVLANWVWTWLELAYGRAAYRLRFAMATSWRGQ